MFKLPDRLARNAGIVVALAVAMTRAGIACGLDWRLPHVGPFADSHFDEQGHVLYAEEIGKLRLGEGESYEEIPLYIKFSSKYQSASPYLGYGWMLPLLDSRIVQLNEREFLAEMPNGWTRVFYRKDANATILQEGGGWKGEIKDNLITIWANCGWKLVFKNGQLVSITTPKNHQLDYQLKDGRVAAIKEVGGKELLRFENEGVAGEVSRLNYGKDQHIEIKLGDKPQVRNLGGQNVVEEIAKSLNKIMLPDHAIIEYNFTVNAQLQPELKISRNKKQLRVLEWEAGHGKIISDNDWKYALSYPVQQALPKIERVNSEGQREFWFKNLHTGEEEILDNQVTVVKRRFLSGPLRGKIRDINVSREHNDNVAKEMVVEADQTFHRKALYDELGNVLRISTTGHDNADKVNRSVELNKTESGGLAVKFNNSGNATHEYSYPSSWSIIGVEEP